MRKTRLTADSQTRDFLLIVEFLLFGSWEHMYNFYALRFSLVKLAEPVMIPILLNIDEYRKPLLQCPITKSDCRNMEGLIGGASGTSPLLLPSAAPTQYLFVFVQIIIYVTSWVCEQ